MMRFKQAIYKLIGLSLSRASAFSADATQSINGYAASKTRKGGNVKDEKEGMDSTRADGGDQGQEEQQHGHEEKPGKC